MATDQDQYEYEDRGAETVTAYRFIARPTDGRRVEYMTNKRGEGLFLRQHSGQISQLLGTGQFRARTLAEFRGRMEGRGGNARGEQRT